MADAANQPAWEAVIGLETHVAVGARHVCLDCQAIGCSPRDCTMYMRQGSSTTNPHKAGHRNFSDAAIRRYKINPEQNAFHRAQQEGIPFRCISCTEEQRENEKNRKRQKKAAVLEETKEEKDKVKTLLRKLRSREAWKCTCKTTKPPPKM